MPAKPSSWAWKLAFRSRSANGERSSISRHQRTVSSSSVASGTTSLTSPISSASSAEYILQRNHISFAFFGDEVGEDGGAESAVEAADLRSDLPELRVVGSDGEVAHHVKDVAPADGVSCNHRDDGLGAAPDLDVQIRDVEASDRPTTWSAPRVGGVLEVSGVPTHPLVATRAEGVGSLPGKDDDPRLMVLTGIFEGLLHLDDRQGTEGVANLGAVYGDLRDPLRLLVPDVLELAG